MTLRVVGAGLGRTGTMSLKLALERLLGAPCYHMLEVFSHPEHVAAWHDALKGRPVDWPSLFDGYAAAVDWPACTFWEQLADVYPDSLILLSTRTDADAWYASADATILELFRQEPHGEPDRWREMVVDMMASFTPDIMDAEQAKAAYERWNADVRSKADPARVVEWQPGDGWEPLCAALEVDVPAEPFPHTNTTSEFRTRAGWD